MNKKLKKVWKCTQCGTRYKSLNTKIEKPKECKDCKGKNFE